MSSFIKNNWVYIFIGFALIIVIGLGILVYQRITVLNTVQNETLEKTELSFSLSDQKNNSAVCNSLTATPTSGSAPLAVSFMGTGQGKQGDTLIYSYVFGDGTSQEVERLVTASDGVESQSVNHTYVNAGSFTAELTVTSSDAVSTACTTVIAVSGLAANITTDQIATASPSPSTATTNKLTLTPTKQPATSLTPTRTPTGTKSITPTPTKRPTPTTADNDSVPAPEIPEAGGFAPTAILGIGGIAILLLAFLL